MQSVSSRIWIRVAVSISYDDNDYTTGTSVFNDSRCLSLPSTRLNTRSMTRRSIKVGKERSGTSRGSSPGDYDASSPPEGGAAERGPYSFKAAFAEQGPRASLEQVFNDSH